jgi:hypothetical protein
VRGRSTPPRPFVPRTDTIGPLGEVWVVVGTSTGFTGERAPCGKRVDGHRYHEEDGSGMVCNDVVYTCGCRETVREFHDGSCRTRIVRHVGRMLLNQLSAEHAE